MRRRCNDIPFKSKKLSRSWINAKCVDDRFLLQDFQANEGTGNEEMSSNKF